MVRTTKKMSVKSLKKLLGKCLIRGPRWYIPQGPPDVPPTWKDVYQLTLNAYTMALEDVLKALNGNSTDLERTCPPDPHSRSGRPFVVNPSTFPWRKRAQEMPVTTEHSGLDLDPADFAVFPATIPGEGEEQ